MYGNFLIQTDPARQHHQQLLEQAERERLVRAARPAQPSLSLVGNFTRKFRQTFRPQTAH